MAPLPCQVVLVQRAGVLDVAAAAAAVAEFELGMRAVTWLQSSAPEHALSSSRLSHWFMLLVFTVHCLHCPTIYRRAPNNRLINN